LLLSKAKKIEIFKQDKKIKNELFSFRTNERRFAFQRRKTGRKQRNGIMQYRTIIYKRIAERGSQQSFVKNTHCKSLLFEINKYCYTYSRYQLNLIDKNIMNYLIILVNNLLNL
jgi:hypothetical protein